MEFGKCELITLSCSNYCHDCTVFVVYFKVCSTEQVAQIDGALKMHYYLSILSGKVLFGNAGNGKVTFNLAWECWKG